MACFIHVCSERVTLHRHLRHTTGDRDPETWSLDSWHCWSVDPSGSEIGMFRTALNRVVCYYSYRPMESMVLISFCHLLVSLSLSACPRLWTIWPWPILLAILPVGDRTAVSNHIQGRTWFGQAVNVAPVRLQLSGCYFALVWPSKTPVWSRVGISYSEAATHSESFIKCLKTIISDSL